MLAAGRVDHRNPMDLLPPGALRAADWSRCRLGLCPKVQLGNQKQARRKDRETTASGVRRVSSAAKLTPAGRSSCSHCSDPAGRRSWSVATNPGVLLGHVVDRHGLGARVPAIIRPLPRTSTGLFDVVSTLSRGGCFRSSHPPSGRLLRRRRTFAALAPYWAIVWCTKVRNSLA